MANHHMQVVLVTGLVHWQFLQAKDDDTTIGLVASMVSFGNLYCHDCFIFFFSFFAIELRQFMYYSKHVIPVRHSLFIVFNPTLHSGSSSSTSCSIRSLAVS